MSLGIRYMRNFLKNTNKISAFALGKTTTLVYNFEIFALNQSTQYNNLVRFSSSSNLLKDSFNTKKPKQEPKQEHNDEDDVDDFETVKNIDQLNQKVLDKFIREEAKYNGRLVYVGGLTSQLKIAKMLSLSSRLKFYK